MLWLLAFRNIFRQFRRYGVLLAALTLGFALLVVVLGLTSGMTRSLERKAALYFAGDVSITGYSKSKFAYDSIDDQETLLNSLKGAGIPNVGFCRRTNYLGLDATLFFNGIPVRQRRLVGVDWEVEKDNFVDMDFLAGGTNKMRGSKGILVSSQVAAKTGVRVGDEILLVMSTRRGAQNTANLVVQGIYRESSIFGSTSYLDIDTMDLLYGQPIGTASDMGIMLTPGISAMWAAGKIRDSLEAAGLQVFPTIETREAQRAALSQKWSGRKYAVMTLRAHLSQIADVLDAVELLAGLVLTFFLLIIVVGVSNTYRMVLRERVREIGVIRTIGMQSSAVRGMFFAEALTLGVIGCLGGFLLGFALLTASTGIDLSNYAILLMFLKQGYPDWYLELPWLLVSAATTFLACLLGVWGPAMKAARVHPAEALNDVV